MSSSDSQVGGAPIRIGSFAVGMMLAPVFVAVAGLPGLLVAMLLSGSPVSEPWMFVAGALVTAVLCASLGFAAARNPFFTWNLVLGMNAMPILFSVFYVVTAISDPPGVLALLPLASAPLFFLSGFAGSARRGKTAEAPATPA